MGSAFFWDIAQRIAVIPYRRFGTPFGPIFKGQEFDDGTDKLSRNAGKELLLYAA